MSAIVIDTNVLLIADGQGKHMSESCRIECEDRLKRIQSEEQVVLDSCWLILSEYKNKLDPNRQPTNGGNLSSTRRFIVVESTSESCPSGIRAVDRRALVESADGGKSTSLRFKMGQNDLKRGCATFQPVASIYLV